MLADPDGSILVDVVEGRAPREAGSWLVEGIGEDFVPADRRPVAASAAPMPIADAKSFAAARELLRKAEGILVGSSTGTLLAAALRYCREQTAPKRVVSSCPTAATSISRRCSTTSGWPTRASRAGRGTGDLRDLISRRYDEGAAVTVAQDDRLNVAYARMKLYDVSSSGARKRPGRRHHRRIRPAAGGVRRTRADSAIRCARQ